MALWCATRLCMLTFLLNETSFSRYGLALPWTVKEAGIGLPPHRTTIERHSLAYDTHCNTHVVAFSLLYKSLSLFVRQLHNCH